MDIIINKKEEVAFNYFGHLVLGALTASFIATTPLDALLVLFGSLLPDIDIKTSTLGRFNPFARFMKHRGWTHTIIGCTILSSPALFFQKHYFIMLLIGCLSHILGDRIQAMYSKRKFKIRLF